MGTYTGTALNDTITPETVSAGVTCVPAGTRPSAAADTISGLGGNDVLDGGGGADTINGGDGNDRITNDGKQTVAYGGAGNDTITFYDNGNNAYGGDGADTLCISYRDDLDYRPSGTSRLYGGTGNDEIKAETPGFNGGVEYGNLTLYAYGEEGDDIIWATSRADTQWIMNLGTDYLYGGPGDDFYGVYEASDAVIEESNQGTDTVGAYLTDYTLPANVENLFELASVDCPMGGFHFVGNELDNEIVTSDFDDAVGYVLEGLGGADTILGCQDGDTIYGGAGNDVLYGKQLGERWYSEDADVIRGGAGNDLIYGAAGDKDTWDGDDKLYGDDGNDRIFGSFGNDLIYGGTGADELGGQAGNDTMYGGTGNDVLGGGTGNDLLYGDADADVLSGRAGLDRLTGGTGNDRFDYDYVTDSRPGSANRDVILDFVGVGAAVGDRIDLSTIDANTSAGGNQAFVFRGTAAFTGAGQVHVIAAGSDTLIQANTGGTLAPELEILVKDGTALPGQWVAGDFIL